jgi:hypothetical protein
MPEAGSGGKRKDAAKIMRNVPGDMGSEIIVIIITILWLL